MRRTFFGVLSTVLVLTGAAAAQQAAQPRTTQPVQPQQAQKPTPPTEQATTVAPREPPGQPVNVKLDLTITDQLGPGEPAKKTISVIVADRAAGNIRSSGNNVRAVLNVDATPQILSNGNIRVLLGLEYNPRQAGGSGPVAKGPKGETIPVEEIPGGSSLNQRVTVVLEPGKPLVLSQAADPISDRKITVEVRATILK
jgi:hypothetical protein